MNYIEYILKIKDEATDKVKDFKNAISDSSEVMDKKFKTGLEGIAKASALVGGTMVAIGAATVGATKSILDAAAGFEQARISFQTLTGSVEKGNALFLQLQEFAKVTPFNLVNLQEYTKRLLAMGATQENVISELGMLGDIASVVGMEKMPQLVLAFGQVRAKTILSGEELRQFSETGIGLIGALSKVTGYSTQQIANGTKDLGITFDQVKQALMTFTQEGGIAYKAMEMQSKTAAGKISNLEDAFVQLKAAAGDALLPTLKTLLDILTPMVSAFQKFAAEHPKLIQFMVALGLIIGAVGVILTTLAAGIIAFVVIASTAFGGVVLAVAGIGVAIGALVAAFFIWKDEILGFLSMVWKAISTFAVNAAKAIADFAVGAWQGMTGWISSTWSKITGFFSNVIGAIGQFFKNVGTAISTTATNIWTSVTTFFTTMWNGIVTFFTPILQFITTVLTAIFGVFKYIFMDLIYPLISYVVQLIWAGIQIAFWAIYETVSSILTAIKDFFVTVFTAIWNFIEPYLTALLNFYIQTFTAIWNFIVTVVTTVWNFLVTAFTAIWEVISTTMVNIWNKIVEIWNLVYGFISSVATAIWSFISGKFNEGYNFLAGVLGKVWQVVSDKFNAVKTTIQDVWGKTVDWFTEKIDAFWQKVQDITGKVKEAFSNMVDGITSVLKKITFPHLKVGEGTVTVAGHEIKYPKLDVDWYEKGGWVGKTGLAMVHQGEFVLSKEMLNGSKSIPSSIQKSITNEVNVNANVSSQIDAMTLGNILGSQLAFNNGF